MSNLDILIGTLAPRRRGGPVIGRIGIRPPGSATIEAHSDIGLAKLYVGWRPDLHGLDSAARAAEIGYVVSAIRRVLDDAGEYVG